MGLFINSRLSDVVQLGGPMFRYYQVVDGLSKVGFYGDRVSKSDKSYYICIIRLKRLLVKYEKNGAIHK